jgi:hypothetical protein
MAVILAAQVGDPLVQLGIVAASRFSEMVSSGRVCASCALHPVIDELELPDAAAVQVAGTGRPVVDRGARCAPARR